MTIPAANRYAVIADDLTGACDAGVAYAERGFRTIAWLAASYADIESCDVTVLTTNSRRDPPEMARGKTVDACRRLTGAGAQIVFKKTDSTFLGNPGAEIEAVLAACGFGVALVCPAFPAMGRTVRGGCLQVAGADAPIDLAARLREQCSCRVLSLAAPDTETLRSIAAEGPALIVADALTQEDLARIAVAGAELSPPPLLAGSAGLAREAAALLASPSARLPPESPRLQRGSVVVFSGSTNPVTLEQVRRLTGMAQTIIVEVDISMPARPSEWLRLASETRGVVLTGGDTALLVLRALGARGIHLEREALTGVPCGRLVGGACTDLPVVTKAGGFGPPDALVRAVRFLSTLGDEAS